MDDSLQPLALTPAARLATASNPIDLIGTWMESKAPGTQRLYRFALKSLGDWAIGEHATAAQVLEALLGAGQAKAQMLVMGWVGELQRRNLAPRTIARMASATSSLVRMARLAGLVPWHLEQVARSAEPRHDRSGPPRHDVAALLRHLETPAGDAAADKLSVRDIAIVRLLHGAGLRRGELVALDMEHLQLGPSPALLVRRKRCRELSRLTIGPRAAAALLRWVELRGDAPGPVFVSLDPTRRGEQRRISGEAVRLMLKRRAEEVGIEAPMRPHGLRHRGATDAERAGYHALLAFGGWASAQSAKQYLDNTPAARAAALATVEL